MARSLNAIRRIDGIAVVQDGELWLLSRPAERCDSEELADLLLTPTLAPRHRFAEVLRAKELIHVDSGRLGKWAYDLGKLESHAGIEKLRG